MSIVWESRREMKSMWREFRRDVRREPGWRLADLLFMSFPLAQVLWILGYLTNLWLHLGAVGWFIGALVGLLGVYISFVGYAVSISLEKRRAGVARTGLRKLIWRTAAVVLTATPIIVVYEIGHGVRNAFTAWREPWHWVIAPLVIALGLVAAWKRLERYGDHIETRKAVKDAVTLSLPLLEAARTDRENLDVFIRERFGEPADAAPGDQFSREVRATGSVLTLLKRDPDCVRLRFTLSTDEINSLRRSLDDYAFDRTTETIGKLAAAGKRTSKHAAKKRAKRLLEKSEQRQARSGNSKGGKSKTGASKGKRS
jgi:hypothetical protein